MQKFKFFVVGLNVVLVICTLLAYLSPLIHPRISVIPALFGLAFPILVGLNIFCILGWLAAQRWYFLISLIALVIGMNRLQRMVQLNAPEPERSELASATTLKLATYNTYQFLKTNQSEQGLYSILEQICADLGQPDVLCLQEAAGAAAHASSLGYPYVYQVPNSWTTVLSRLPILSHNEIVIGSARSLSGWIDLDVQGDTVRLYALHLRSNRITLATEHLLEEGSIQKRKSWVELSQMVKKYLQASAIRSDQVEVIRNHISKSPYPTIVCGDFNDVPQSYPYHVISANLKDGYMQRGRGTGSTYALSLPGLRIDYILAGMSFDFVTHRVLPLEYSDHYPVVAELRLLDL